MESNCEILQYLFISKLQHFELTSTQEYPTPSCKLFRGAGVSVEMAFSTAHIFHVFSSTEREGKGKKKRTTPKPNQHPEHPVKRFITKLAANRQTYITIANDFCLSVSPVQLAVIKSYSNNGRKGRKKKSGIFGQKIHGKRCGKD